VGFAGQLEKIDTWWEGDGSNAGRPTRLAGGLFAFERNGDRRAGVVT
jgi:hypothetical protein